MAASADFLPSTLSSSLPVSVLVGVVIAMGLLSWARPGGRISFFESKENNLFLTRRTGKSGAKDRTTLAELCRSATPARCDLNPFLFNGHLQTCWTTVKFDKVPVYYKRRVFEADSIRYQGRFAIDFVVEPYEAPKSPKATDAERKYTLPSGLPERTAMLSEKEFAALPSDDTKPMLVVLHGLSGGSHELYLRHVVHPLIADGGWEACVINSRGCAQTKISTGVLYNARATWDVRQAVKWLRAAFPNRPLFGIGFSLGANILANYLGEEGDACQLKAAVLCASPWNLEISSVALQSSFMGLEVYSKVMGDSMKQLFEQHAEEAVKNPRIDAEAIRSITYLHEFDRALQCPLWGYPTEGAYYRDASSVDSLLSIRIPFFVVQAEDDPVRFPKDFRPSYIDAEQIACVTALPFQEIAQTPYGVMMTTSWGGHLGWFEFGGDRWFVKPITNFLNSMAKEIELETPPVVEKPEQVHGRSSSSHDDADIESKAGDFNPMQRKLTLPIIN